MSHLRRLAFVAQMAALLLTSCAHPRAWSPKKPSEQLVGGGPTGCATYLDDARPVMGTWVDVQLCAATPRDLKADADAAFAEFQRLDALLSVWKPQSEISAVNREAGKQPVAVSPDTVEVLADAQRFSEQSNGLFDITFASLKLWHFDEDLKAQVPSPEQVKERLATIGWRHVILDSAKHTAFIDREGTRIDLGGIGKGFAVDKVVALLRARGLRDFVVKAGGDLYCAGMHGERPWRIGVRDPRDDDAGFFAVMPVKDAAFSTSGDYERFFIKDGKRYHHIIDPRTGYPATASRSATVLTRTATEAEGLSKPVFILGPKAGADFAVAQGAQAVIVGADNHVAVTPGLAGLQILHPPTPGDGP
jgi:FAD:protein FMN transferase